MSGQLNEATPNIQGFPKEFIKTVFQRYQLDYDVEPKPMTKKPSLKDVKNGVVLSKGKDGNFYALSSTSSSKPEAMTVAMIDGKIKQGTGPLSRLKDQFKAGEYVFLKSAGYRSNSRHSMKRNYGDLDSDYIGTMNRVFMPALRKKIEAALDRIYGAMRRLSNDHTERGEKVKDRFDRDRTQKKVAIEIAELLEKISKKGFTRDTMEEFLRAEGRARFGFGSIPSNNEELMKIMKEPLGKAKFAKVLFSRVRELSDRAIAMIDSDLEESNMEVNENHDLEILRKMSGLPPKQILNESEKQYDMSSSIDKTNYHSLSPEEKAKYEKKYVAGGVMYVLKEEQIDEFFNVVGADQVNSNAPSSPDKSATFTQTQHNGKDSVTVTATADDMAGIHELLKLAGIERDEPVPMPSEEMPMDGDDCDVCSDEDPRQGPPAFKVDMGGDEETKSSILSALKQKLHKKFN